MLTARRVRTASRTPNAGRSLSLRRAWYADGQSQGTGSAGGGQAGTGSSTTDDVPIDALPVKWQAEIKKLREEAAENRAGRTKAQEEAAAKAKELELAAQREQQRLIEEGKFKELADKFGAEAAALRPYQERATALETRIKQHNETRIARIPEVMRSVIPGEYSPEKLSEWLDANESKLTTPPAPNIDAGAGGGGGKPPVKLTDYERQMAAAMGITEKEYALWKSAGKGAPPMPDLDDKK